MVLEKLLKRKDATSVIVAIVLALAVSTFLVSVSMELSQKLSGVESELSLGDSVDWQARYLQPFVLLLLQVAFLEVLARVVIAFKSFLTSSK